jgi:monoterpene epsilon-lactone hydrolase
MPSIRMRFLNPVVRMIVKRKSWGRDEYALARRARRIFGAPRFWGWLAARSVAITKVDDGSVRGEWIEPKTVGSDAVLLYIHGGGFVSCSTATHRPIAAAFARAAKIKVFSLDYRLAPENRFPAAVEDVYNAFKWLAERTEASRIAVAGDSAGGGLVLSLILKLRQNGSPLPACAVCFSPWADLTGSGESVKTNAKADRMFYPETEHQFARAYLAKESDATNILASPVFADFEGFPPVLFQVGSTEILVDDSRRIHEKILAAGGTSEMQIYDDVFHTWQMAVGLLPEADTAIRRAAEFINNHIGSHR